MRLRWLYILCLLAVPVVTVWLSPRIWDLFFPLYPAMHYFIAALLYGLGFVIVHDLFNRRVDKLLGSSLNHRLLSQIGRQKWSFLYRGVRICSTPKRNFDYTDL